MKYGRHRLVSWLMCLATLFLTVNPVLALQESTPAATPAATDGSREGQPVIFFASDGMRPDLAQQYIDAGLLPTLAGISENGATGDNGLQQAFPANTGVGWPTLATGTWPGEHGSVNNTYYRTGDTSFGNTSSGFDGSLLQAQTIMQAAEQSGKTVVSIDWTGVTSLSPALTGPTIDYRSFFSDRGILVNYDVENQPANAETFGVTYQRTDLVEATGWANVPESFSPALEQQLVVTTTWEEINPNRFYDLYIYDSADDGTVNYDRVTVVPAEAATDAATPAASPVVDAASPVAASGTKDGSLAVGDIAQGEWLDIKVALTGDRAGETAGFWVKLIDLNDDASQFRLYYTSVSQTNASYLALGDEGSAAFKEYLNATFGSATGPDYAPLEAGIVDEETWSEQGKIWQQNHLAFLDYLFTDLGVTPDLLMLGTPLTDEFSHQLLGLITETDADGNPNPYYDDVNGDGTTDGRVAEREGLIQWAYQSADELLGSAMDVMGEQTNVFVTSDHGFAPAWYSVNGALVLQNAGLVSAGCGIYDDDLLATVKVKVCGVGGSANIYINLVDRDNPGVVTQDEYEAVRDQIIAAFQGLTDPAHPEATVVEAVYRKEELSDVQGVNALHPSRTGDVVVALKSPYQFDGASADAVIAPSQFFGQHGYLPNTVDLANNINLHGMFLAAGPAIAQGVTVSGVRAIDVAPTVAYVLNIPGPTSASGQILYDALANGENLREVTILDISDFHGQLIPLTASPDSFTTDGAIGTSEAVGGVAYLKVYLDQFEGEARDGAILVTAGDSIGATPPLSAFFDDLPTIEMLNALGLDADGIGNHNFDVSSDFFTTTIMPQANYPYLSANVVLSSGQQPVAIASPSATPFTETGTPWAPSATFTFNGVTLGLIGFSNDDIPSLTRPGALGPFEVTDPIAAVNAEAQKLREQGIPVVVAMGHMGATSGDYANPEGPGIELADSVENVDVVIGDHTDQASISTRSNGVLYTEVASKGVQFSRIRIVVDTTTNEVVYKTADHHRPWTIGITPDPEIAGYLDDLNVAIEPILGEVVGSSTVTIPRADSCGTDNGRTCESLEGNVVTDAMRTTYGVDFAITNSGGLRADLTCPAEDIDGDFCGADVPENSITRGQVLGVLPFGNVAVTLEVTGAELKQMLEAGVAAMPSVAGAFPQVSGLCFTYDLDREPGDRVVSAVRQAEDGSCTGEAVDFSETATYTIASNDFTIAGGDGYPDLSAKATTREVLDEIVAAYVGGNSPFAVPGAPLDPTLDGRIVCQGEGCPVAIAEP